MITSSQICCVIEPVDMRRGLDSLSQWIQISLGATPCDGTAYAFSNRPKPRLKLLIWDGTGCGAASADCTVVRLFGPAAMTDAGC